jgi:predicted Rossmann fold nucleotide-binding protein DprA/Smf involved in DNA uptake
VCRSLARAGATIVSGGANGVDSYAHRAALAVGGATVVCLPAGLANGGTAKQRSLCDDVLRNGGAVVSCERLDSGHQRGGYRRRNAVIVSLIDALLVVCGGVRSGTLITAALADRAAIPRRAIPWSPGTPCSDGSNELLASGWRALSQIDDGEVALDRLLSDCPIDGAVRGWQRYAPLKLRKRSPLRGPAGTSPQLVAAIDRALAERPNEGLSLEELVEAHGGSRGQLAALLLHMRMTNQLQPAAFGRYVRCG